MDVTNQGRLVRIDSTNSLNSLKLNTLKITLLPITHAQSFIWIIFTFKTSYRTMQQPVHSYLATSTYLPSNQYTPSNHYTVTQHSNQCTAIQQPLHNNPASYKAVHNNFEIGHTSYPKKSFRSLKITFFIHPHSCISHI